MTQVPLSIEFLDEPGDDLVNEMNASAAPPLMKLAYNVFTDAVRRTPDLRRAAAAQNEKFTQEKLQDWNRGPNAMDRTYWSATASPAPSPSSINYAMAGNSVPVFVIRRARLVCPSMIRCTTSSADVPGPDARTTWSARAAARSQYKSMSHLMQIGGN